MLDSRRAPQQGKQMLALLFWRDRLSRSADGQHAIAATFVVQAFGEEAPQIIVADRLARCHRAVAKHQEGLATLHTIDLSGQRLEEGGGPDDRVGEAGRHQDVLERQLGLLKGETRLLNADCGQEHHVRDPCFSGDGQRIRVSLIIDGPGVLRSPRSRRQTRDQRIEALAADAVAR